MRSIAIWTLTGALVLSAPTLAAPTAGSNVEIGYRTNVETVSLAWDPASDNLFAVTLLETGLFVYYVSSDAGGSWTQRLENGPAVAAAEVAVAGGYAYIGYVLSSEVSEVEAISLRRASAATGTLDGDYGDSGSHLLVDVHPLTIEELVLASNHRSADDRIFVAALLSDNTVRFWWDDPSDGETFTEASPGVTNADSGLDVKFNFGSPAIVLSYVGTDDAVYVHQALFAWDGGQAVATGESEARTTSVDAWGNVVIVIYRSADGDGNEDAVYRISYDYGASWASFAVGNASGGVGFDYFKPMVSASSGTGLAVLLEQNTSGEDPYWFRHRVNYVNGAWGEAVELNDHNYSYGAVDFTSDFEWMGHGWGMAYRTTAGEAWFAWSRLIRYSGFEVGGLGEWSSTAGGP